MKEFQNISNIVLWGGYQYFREIYEKLNKKINAAYLFANKKYVKDTFGLQIIDNTNEIMKLDNPYVIICLAKVNDVAETAKWCSEHGIKFTHADFVINKFYRLKYINAMGGKYLDKHNNQIFSNSRVSENIYIETGAACDSYIEIGDINVKERLYIKMLGHNGTLKIGDGTTMVSTNIIVNSNGTVKIGSDCMFAHTISIMQSDQHLIFDATTKKRINYAKNITVGNHVWLGRECELLGGAVIGDNSICGARTVTSGVFPNNVIIAGCPAKIIRENIIWSRDLVEQCDYDSFDECKDKKALDYM